MIIENTFTSISHLADSIFPTLSYFKKFILKLDWNSISRIVDIEVPILFIVGTADEVIPHNHVRLLFNAAKKAMSKKFIEVEGGHHNDTWFVGGSAYF